MFSIIKICNFSTANILKRCVRFKFSTKSKTADMLEDEPVKYSASPASKYKAKFNRIGAAEPRLWYEPHILTASIAIFLIYFAILREENDIDQELNRSLYSRISGLEEHQLKLSLEYNRLHGLETEELLKRLKEIEAEKNKLVD